MSQVKRNSSQGFVSRLGYEFQSSVDEWLSRKEKEVEELMKNTPFYGYTINLKWRGWLFHRVWVQQMREFRIDGENENQSKILKIQNWLGKKI